MLDKEHPHSRPGGLLDLMGVDIVNNVITAKASNQHLERLCDWQELILGVGLSGIVGSCSFQDKSDKGRSRRPV